MELNGTEQMDELLWARVTSAKPSEMVHHEEAHDETAIGMLYGLANRSPMTFDRLMGEYGSVEAMQRSLVRTLEKAEGW